MRLPPRVATLTLFIALGTARAFANAGSLAEPVLFPQPGATGVNPDIRPSLTFASEPVIGTAGRIQIFDAANDQLVDELDLAIPAGPTTPNRTPAPYTPRPYDYTRPVPYPTNANTAPGTPSGPAAATPATHQLTIIGGFTDGFHFHPVLVHGRTATIQPHHNRLEYGKTYYVQIGPGVLTTAEGPFAGVKGKERWRFSTKAQPPSAAADPLVVASDGSGDFNTVQGAVDFVPDDSARRITIFIRRGVYEEIVYFRNKANLTILGEDRENTIVCYRNNEVFNPRPLDVATNEWPGTFPTRRAAFAADNCRDLQLVNLTIRSINDRPAQAEGLFLMGERNLVSHVTIEGSGDALQANGSVYFQDSSIKGYGDNILGRGPGFYRRVDLISTFGPHMWIRNTAANHGNVFVHSTFRTIGDVETVFARAPANRNTGYPHCEAVLLDCVIEGIRPEGWGPVGSDATHVRYWEFNSTNLSDGKPAEVGGRAAHSRQLTMEKDAALIAQYRDPAFVLGGWQPAMAPRILQQPGDNSVAPGAAAELRVVAAAVPDATYQWFRDDVEIAAATNAVLRIESAAAAHNGRYTVTVRNASGRAQSRAAVLTVR